eukprot:80333-Chlamydomonas_euryale.AAC.9
MFAHPGRHMVLKLTWPHMCIMRMHVAWSLAQARPEWDALTGLLLGSHVGGTVDKGVFLYLLIVPYADD